MKKNILSFILMLCFAMSPIYGQTTYQIQLNGMSYKGVNPTLVIDNVYYISLDDLILLTYGSYSKEDDNYTLNIQKDTMVLSAPNRSFTLNGKQVILTSPIRAINEVIYVPIEILDHIDYPYTLDTQSGKLVIDAVAPYSRTTDHYKDHITYNHKDFDFNKLISNITTEEEYTDVIQSAKQNKRYISFILNPTNSEFWELMHEEVNTLPSITVTVRNFDFLSNTPHNSNFTTLPIKAKVRNNTFSLTLGDASISTNCLQTAFYPYKLNQTIDVSKTIDATIMRLIYEYYRDHYDLKDDVHYSPITFIQAGRCDYSVYPVYSDHLIDEAYVYELAIYKQITENGINYIVDIIREI